MTAPSPLSLTLVHYYLSPHYHIPVIIFFTMPYDSSVPIPLRTADHDRVHDGPLARAAPIPSPLAGGLSWSR